MPGLRPLPEHLHRARSRRNSDELGHLRMLLEAFDAPDSVLSDWDIPVVFREFATPDGVCEIDVLVHVPGRGLVIVDLTELTVESLRSKGSVSSGIAAKFDRPIRQARLLKDLLKGGRFGEVGNVPLAPMVAWRNFADGVLASNVPPSDDRIARWYLGSDLEQLPAQERAQVLKVRLEGAFDLRAILNGQRSRVYPVDGTPRNLTHDLLISLRDRSAAGKPSIGELVPAAIHGSDAASYQQTMAIWDGLLANADPVAGRDIKGTFLRGYAGTGKTWTALAGVVNHCLAPHGTNPHALLLCSSRALADHLRSQVADYLDAAGGAAAAKADQIRDRLTIAVPEDLAGAAGHATDARKGAVAPAQLVGGPRDYLIQAEYWLELASSRTGEFGLVVVDEAQDFGGVYDETGAEAGDAFDYVEELLAPGGTIVLLGDPDQMTASGREGTTWTGPDRYRPDRRVLRNNLRCTNEIADALRAVTDLDYSSGEAATATPDSGIPVEGRRVEPGPGLGKRVEAELKRMLEELAQRIGNLSTHDITILVQTGEWQQDLETRIAAGGWSRMARGVQVRTVDAFKGLEATYVAMALLTHDPAGRPYVDRDDEVFQADAYVGASRARAWLAFVHDGLLDDLEFHDLRPRP